MSETTVPGVPETNIPVTNEEEKDPYDNEGERAECNDVITKIMSAVGFGYGGPFSTWRERHIGIAGATAGWRAGTTSLDGKCPTMWLDERQYYEGMWMIFNIAKCQWPSVLAFGTATIAALGTGIIRI